MTKKWLKQQKKRNREDFNENAIYVRILFVLIKDKKTLNPLAPFYRHNSLA